ncbi:MAG: PQQ-binding-like beta-propeller repeat protein [Candidatus Eremiobacteraeota bacterium]|nr:PQQ-binding-like beta-propeller repeat protein [Candidatus Eremiobacteraeota bacterium]MBV8596260.1 PQQ-binding-like beta-propeller repeat protein [Candidatus Eremiobacteraeota bacterium]MBV8669424.1 PQQ-binding-like beta-propeller repeat protein [Candidatus Eremiobacteraeota bacterium]
MGTHICRVAFVVLACLVTACGGGGSSSTTPPVGVNAQGNATHTRDDWPMYAHDAHHTSASSASLSGPLQASWRYNPQAISGDTFSTVDNAIATVTGVYVHWEQYGATVFAGGPSFDGISPAGQGLWTYCEHRDYDEGHWSSVFSGAFVFEDDGQQFLNLNTGVPMKTPAKKWSTGYDLWGESIADTSGLYSVNTFLADGADLFVYSLDASGGTRWTQNQQKSTKYSQDQAGGLVLAGGVLFYAPNYSDPSPFASGVYALSAATGTRLAYVSTLPTSELSADGQNIYLIENSSKLTARAQSDLHVVWSTTVTSTSPSPPVLAAGLVIVATTNGIEAHAASSGKLVWTAAVTVASGSGYSTAMAAALGSNTLLVTAWDGLHLLRLSNGSPVWHGTVAGAGTLVDPVIVNDPARGPTVYVTDGRGVIALVPG